MRRVFSVVIPEKPDPSDWQPFRFGGKENLGSVGLNLLDFGARMFSPSAMRWTTMDPMAEKYYDISPYVYCAGNPVNYVDPDGTTPRIFVETKGFGHAFVSAGSGNNTVVYTYGRYGGLEKNKSIARSTTPTGEGVLVKLTGKEALSYINKKVSNDNASVFEFTNIDDKDVQDYFDTQLSTSTQNPSSGVYSDSDNAKVVDKYNLLSNNCVTTSINGLQSVSSADLKLSGIITPLFLKIKLLLRSQSSNEINKVNYEAIQEENN